MDYEREKLAEFLFDGDKAKAKALLTLLDEKSFKAPPEFKNLKMQLPEYSCLWCTLCGECYVDMPDSLRDCEGKCSSYQEMHCNGGSNENN